jgi:hypothetical protein
MAPNRIAAAASAFLKSSSESAVPVWRWTRAARQGLGDQVVAAGLALEGFEHGQARLHHLEADAVAGEYRDLALGSHVEPPRRSCRSAGHPPL